MIRKFDPWIVAGAFAVCVLLVQPKVSLSVSSQGDDAMLRLTSYDDNEPVYVVAEGIVSMRQLPAETDELIGFEIGRRTRIDTKADSFLVQEEAHEIWAMMNNDDRVRDPEAGKP